MVVICTRDPQHRHNGEVTLSSSGMWPLLSWNSINSGAAARSDGMPFWFVWDQSDDPTGGSVISWVVTDEPGTYIPKVGTKEETPDEFCEIPASYTEFISQRARTSDRTLRCLMENGSWMPHHTAFSFFEICVYRTKLKDRNSSVHVVLQPLLMRPEKVSG